MVFTKGASVGAGHRHSHLQPDSYRDLDEVDALDVVRGGKASRRAAIVLLAVLIPILIATAVAAVQLWPHGTPPRSDLAVTTGAEEQTVAARVLSSSATECPGTTEDRLPNGDIPAAVTCATAQVMITSGKDSGQRLGVAVPPPVYRSGLTPGTVIRLAYYPPIEDAGGDQGVADDFGTDMLSTAGEDVPVSPDDVSAAVAAGDLGTLPNGDVYVWADFSRGRPLGILAVVFTLMVVTVGRFRGMAALLGLGVAGLAIDRFMLPALQLGENPVAVAVVCSIAIMTVLLYGAHGLSTKTTTALLGTIFGLAASAGLADWASTAAHLNGLGSEDNYTLSTLTTRADLSGVILCGIIIASLGVLNDVTVTQSSAVWELHEHAPHLSAPALFRSGMRVGRDHLASTVYTIVFAYCGAALPTILLIDIYQRPLGQVLTSVDIAEELARTFVGSIGLILAIPLTTAIAAAAVATSRAGSEARTAVAAR